MPRKSTTNVSTLGSRKSSRIAAANANANTIAVAVPAQPASAPVTGGKRKATNHTSHPPAKKVNGNYSSTQPRKTAVPKKPVPKVKAKAVPAKKKPKAPAKGRGHSTQAKGAAKAAVAKNNKRKAAEEYEDAEHATPPPPAKKPKKSKVVSNTAPIEKKVLIPKPPKPVKQLPEINTVPTQVLDVYVFGEGTAGQLGLGNGIRRDVMGVKRPRLNRRLGADEVGVVQIAIGGMHAAALTRDNKILTWGCNDTGALGRETRRQQQDDEDDDDEDKADLNPLEAEPREVDSAHFPAGTKFSQLECTDGTTFAVTTTGLVYGWGQFRACYGPIGFSFRITKDQPNYQATPMLIPGLKNITSLTSGTNHVVALDTRGNVWAWGATDSFQLARSDRVSKFGEHSCLHPMRVPGLEGKKIDTVGCGDMYTIAVDDAGIAYSWGINASAECSIHPVVKDKSWTIEQPQVVQGLGAHHIKQVVGGTHHTLALASDGKVLVWGNLESSRSGLDLATLPEDAYHAADLTTAGIPNNKYLTQPTVIPGLTATHIAAGNNTSAVITTNGQLYTWGYNGTYSAGQGPNNSRGSDSIALPEQTVTDNVAQQQTFVPPSIPEAAVAEGVVKEAVAAPVIPEPVVVENPEEKVVEQASAPEEKPVEKEVVEKTTAVETVVEEKDVEMVDAQETVAEETVAEKVAVEEEPVVEKPVVEEPVAEEQPAAEETVAQETAADEMDVDGSLPDDTLPPRPWSPDLSSIAEDKMKE